MQPEHPGFSRFGLILLALMALGWGFNWPIMKIVLADVPPLTFRGVCLLTGGVGILAIARAAGHSITIPRASWPQLLVLCAFNIVGWNVFVIYGIALLPAGRAALLGYTMPLWSVPLSVWLLDEDLTPRRIFALVLGIAGVVALMGADFARFGTAITGVTLLLAAAFSWGLGIVLLKRFAPPLPTVSLTGWLMLIGGIPIALAAVLLEHDAWRAVSLYPALGVLYNVVVAFMFCYWAWNRIVLMVPVAVSSLSSLVTPVIGVLSGMWLLNERLSWHEVAAAGLILCAIMLVLRAPETRPAAASTDAPLA
ncbi:MAG: DMT family transporter [Sulfurifustis sp.]